MAENRILEVFRTYDKAGTGKIGRDELFNLCMELDIRPNESDLGLIFDYLDRDGDGQVSLNDFARGFVSYFKGEEEDSSDLNTKSIPANQRIILDRRRSDARLAWSHLVEGIGEPAVIKFLDTSGKQLQELYHEIQTTASSPELVTHYEQTLGLLFQDVKRLHDDNKKLEQTLSKEKELHFKRLQGLEEELDAQVAKVEAEAKEEARLKFELQKKEIMQKMEEEMNELQTQLKIFQKVNAVLTQKREENNTLKHTAAFENQELRSALSDMQTNWAVIRTEMSMIKSEYEAKCRELNSHQEVVMQYYDQNNHIKRKLDVLHEANKNLHDTNDTLLSVIETTGGRVSPFSRSRRASSESNLNAFESTQSVEPSRSLINLQKVDNNILNEQNCNSGAHYVMQRLMEDIDSGHSTLQDTVECDCDRKSNQEEFCNLSESALKSLDSDYSENSQSLRRRFENTHSVISDATSCEPVGNPDRTFKIVLAGDAAVGKSCFIHRFCKGIFVHNLGSTLGVDFQIKTIKVDEKNVALQLWDTAGQERFRSMTTMYFRRADGIVLLYDVTNERSFVSLRQWMQSIRDATDKNIPILISGNKIDLIEEAKSMGATCVETRHAENLATDYGAIFYETSSKSGKNLVDALITLTREMLLREDVEVQMSALRVGTQTKKKSLNICCRN